MTAERIFTIFKNHIPPPAVDYAFSLWQQTPFELKLAKSRQTKVGDFTCKRNAKRYRITLNHDLNSYLFLITYVHEVAHLRTYLHYADRVEPHGNEWKHVFQNLMMPVLKENVFPDKILPVLKKHMDSPKASSFADSLLTQTLREYDRGSASHIIVGSLPEGTIFKLQGKFFKKGPLKRTRIICRELKSRRHYLVPCDALVSDVQLSLL